MNQQTTASAVEIDISQIEKDVFDVKQTMLNYVWSLDTSDWERLRKVFSDDIVFRASNMGHYVGGDALVREFQNRTVRTPIRRHMLVSPYVKVDGDTAVYTSYVINVRVRPQAPGGEYHWGSGYYKNSFRRRQDGTWEMYDFKWEQTLLEGNLMLIPAMGQMIYLPVMDAYSQAPWGGPTADATERDALSNSRQVADMMVGLTRAADARNTQNVGAALVDGVELVINGGTLNGRAKAAATLSQRDAKSWQNTLLTNSRVSVVGNSARYGAYYYINPAADPEKPARHFGGLLTAELSHSSGGWKVAKLTFTQMWDRDEKVLDDRAASVKASELARWVFGLEDSREQQRDEEEVMALMSRYTWAYDTNDIELMRDIFHEDVDSSFHMGASRWNIGREAILEMNKAGRPTVRHAQHYVYNLDVKIGFDGESAFLRCYSNTRRTHDDSGLIEMAGGHYVMHARRYDGKWKFDMFRYTRAHDPHL